MALVQSEKKWLFRQDVGNISEEQIKNNARHFGIPEIVVRIIALRGISDKETINEFLNPVLAQLPRPHLMKGMTKAVSLLLEAVKFQKPVTVFGDFDADGITATSILVLFFKELGISVNHYIPDRLSEGYGLNSEAIRKIHDNNTQQWNTAGILLTADCGISDAEVVEEAIKLGFKVIITDHHRPPSELPKADTILNPLQPDCFFPYKNLAGVGVAFYLMLGLRSELVTNGHWPGDKIPNLKSYMDLVAIGTVADQVSLTGCNRIIVKAGLEVINMAGRVGLQELLANARNATGVSTEDIAFRLAPRINAAGRMGSALTAVELMTTASRCEAQQLANKLEKANAARKNIEAEIFAEAVHMVTPVATESAYSLTLYKSDWHQGVLGIVASRLCDRFHRPVILLTDCVREQEKSLNLVKGSGRSVEGIDIYEAVSSCREFLLRYGGHSGAVGLTLPAGNIDSFRCRFDTYIQKQLPQKASIPSLTIDMEITLDTINNLKFLDAYSSLSPFGVDNPEPVFYLRSQKLSNLRHVGANHLKFTVSSNGILLNGIGFGLGNLIQIAQDNFVDLAFTLRLNSFTGQTKWEINLLALRPTMT